MFHDVFEQLLQRPDDSHKFSYGHVLVIGGSSGMTGAAILTAQAALRSGAGLVTLAITDNQPAGLVKPWPEIITAIIPDTEALATFIDDRQVSVVAIGPGLAPSTDVLDRLRWLVQQPHLTLIIDGGALVSLATELTLLSQRRCRAVIVTPHPGEFKQLLHGKLAADRSQQTRQAQAFAKQHDVICVLKGQASFVAAQDMPSYTNHSGNPGLATAGSGDVLTGIIAALIAQHVEPVLAAQCGVYLHGRCGDIAAAQLTQPAVIASDIIAAIPQAYKQIEAEF